MEPPASEHDRELEEFTTAVDQTRAAFADMAAAFRGLEEVWDRGLRETLQRLDEFQQGVEEALRLTHLLVDRTPRPV
ncbi:hypothetical protein LWC34_54340 [Kibdelosporangium philippinense]|uniref:WXG100 family type VII secretion target n=1 Tax=Kibdelosporangium philippinense TaxID=211113 RepID=A0ABS8ZVX8_9PSEU|nr:hypothetical protein [Kibdelosporangium philippinense]MCE7011739.1 hypothetical protein [Kibdelosporangium philippinense]